jgi:prolyl-tRNA synthetase
MLEVYRWFAEDVLAMPVIPGVKTPSERFAGAVETYSIEAMMQDNRALQAATSHDLGQNFARAFDVTFQDADGRVDHVWATSWGMSTRIIGALIMTHSDDAGLVLPPRIARWKVVVVPIWRNDEERTLVLETARRVADDLRDGFGPVQVDDRDKMRPGWKYAEWEAKGVPVRIEIGPRDVAAGQAMLAARHDRKKTPVPLDGLAGALRSELDRIQRDLYDAAVARREQNTHRLDDWDAFLRLFEGEGGFAHCHWCGDDACEARIQEETRVTIRNVPLDREEEAGTCVRCGRPSRGRVVFAQAY